MGNKHVNPPRLPEVLFTVSEAYYRCVCTRKATQAVTVLGCMMQERIARCRVNLFVTTAGRQLSGITASSLEQTLPFLAV